MEQRDSIYSWLGATSRGADGSTEMENTLQPFTDLESETSTDWYPEDTCYFCNAKKQPPYDPASGIIPTVEGYNSLH
ncbi:mushroom body large-type Kenyon cell-specific protein 1 [Caerostris extrusa]|uniref:Mushroom body large-type Kenyon cell-specific protein 1 n=1 Tax=Caerostris extrusa TaxID=172846 RepID=A0AAV4WN99_CAEEX|nr:mushroom body large-type Kenyon cell-specific protein 1 [Caerostris extrusa]